MTTERCRDAELAGELSAFAPLVATHSLHLLRAVDRTLDALGAADRMARPVTDEARRLTGQIRAHEPETGSFLDPEDAIIDGIEKSYRSLESRLPALAVRKLAIDKDRQLSPSHRELLHDAYDAHIATIAELIEAGKDLRAAVIAHDLAAEQREVECFDSVPELIASLRR